MTGGFATADWLTQNLHTRINKIWLRDTPTRAVRTLLPRPARAAADTLPRRPHCLVSPRQRAGVACPPSSPALLSTAAAAVPGVYVVLIRDGGAAGRRRCARRSSPLTRRCWRTAVLSHPSLVRPCPNRHALPSARRLMLPTPSCTRRDARIAGPNSQLLDKRRSGARAGFMGMGERGVGGGKCGATCATVLAFKEDGVTKLLAANVGDSRALLIKCGPAAVPASLLSPSGAVRDGQAAQPRSWCAGRACCAWRRASPDRTLLSGSPAVRCWAPYEQEQACSLLIQGIVACVCLAQGRSARHPDDGGPRARLGE